jgi:malonyl CoA-acyl carrier protein transacylase
MGAGLFDEVQEFASLERDMDTILGYSIRTLCLEDPGGRLNDTRYTQPALYVTNALHYYRAIAQGERPTFVAGHSLGEYNALLAAGAFDFLTGLRLVQKRAELMASAPEGGMAAIVGLSLVRVAAVMEQNSLSTLDIANYNSPVQTVISGPADAINRARPLFEKAGAQLYMPLQVSRAFHSRYMADAAGAFADFLGAVGFQPLRATVLSNVTGQPYPEACSAGIIRSLLAQQISQPVRWMQLVQALLARGGTTFRELGPGTTLTRLVQQIRRENQA